MTADITELDKLNLAFAERFNAQDLDGLHDLFEADAIFVPAPGTPVPAEGVRGALEQFLGLNLPITMSVRNAFATMTRVDAGSMTESSSPRSAARKGDATLYVYSFARRVRTAATSSPASSARLISPR